MSNIHPFAQPTLVLLCPKKNLLNRARKVLRGKARVLVVEDSESLVTSIMRPEVTGAIIDLQDSWNQSLAPVVGTIRTSRPELPIVVYTSFLPEVAKDIVAMAKQGVNDLILADFEDDAQCFQRILERLQMVESARVLKAVESTSLAIGKSITDDLLQALASQPELLYQLHPRSFEKLIAELFHRQGFDVALTACTRDGGKDLIVSCQSVLGQAAYYVECKRYAPSRAVDTSVVRQLYGVVQANRVTGGILATTSFFTRAAIAFQSQVPYQINLKDGDSLKAWLDQIVKRSR